MRIEQHPMTKVWFLFNENRRRRYPITWNESERNIIIALTYEFYYPMDEHGRYYDCQPTKHYWLIFDYESATSKEHFVELQYPLNYAEGWFESRIEELVADQPLDQARRMMQAITYSPD